MNFFIALFFSSLLYLDLDISAKKVTTKDYCMFGLDNNVCKTACNPSKTCGTIVKHGPLSKSEKKLILKLHNEYRNKVARGDYRDHGFPKATDMEVLSYDRELEFLALCWTYQCTMEYELVRRDHKGLKVGQNLRMITGPIFEKMDEAWIKKVIDEIWFNGYKNISLLNAEKLLKGLGPVFDGAEFAQMIWGSTQYIGCAKIYFKTSVGIGKTVWKNAFQFLCNYKPAGYISNLPAYMTEPIEFCDKNEEYPALCGRIRPVSEDTFVPPVNLSQGKEDSLDAATLAKSNCYVTYFGAFATCAYYYIVIVRNSHR